MVQLKPDAFLFVHNNVYTYYSTLELYVHVHKMKFSNNVCVYMCTGVVCVYIVLLIDCVHDTH